MSINEIWKAIEGYEGLYEVSNLGRVKSLDRIKGVNGALRDYPGRILRASGSLYPLAVLVRNGEKRPSLVHRLVAQTFIPNPLDLPEVNHINGNKLDARVDNLEWVTSSQNQIHSYETGLQIMRFGEQHHNAKLTEKTVRQIRQDWGNGLRNGEIARKYCVHRRTVTDICLRKTWPHI